MARSAAALTRRVHWHHRWSRR